MAVFQTNIFCYFAAIRQGWRMRSHSVPQNHQIRQNHANATQEKYEKVNVAAQSI